MYDILLPIKPYYAYLIMKGEKTVEVRKFDATNPNWSGKFKCYVSKDKTSLERIPEADRAEFEKYLGKVAFEFEYDYIDDLHEWELSPSGRHEEFEQKRLNEFLKDSCLTINEICIYRQKLPYYKPLYGYHITDLNVYDKPRELDTFYAINTCTKECREYHADRCEGVNKSGKCGFGCKHTLTRPPRDWQYVKTPDWEVE